MAIQQTKKQSDLEKRLKLLRQQIYGKETVKYILPTAEGPLRSAHLAARQEASGANYTDLTYLYQDLFKILALSSIAIGVQTILFFLSKNHILSLNLF